MKRLALDAEARAARSLNEAAKHVVLPSGIVGSDWPKLYNRTIRRKLGVTFDGWQQGAGKVLLARRANGRLAHTIGGFGVSAPRQIGKTYFVAPTLFGLSIDRPNMLSLWSAHHSKTHNETFLEMQAFAKRPQVQPFIRQVRTGSGDEAVEFVNGSRILFGARDCGFGRGIPNVDCEVFDEAQILTAKALENMLAAMNRSMFGLHVYLGTPPVAGNPCESFEGMRTECLEAMKVGGELDSAWIEFGADDGADLDDRAQWAKANPSYPHYTSDESMLRLRKKLGPEGMRTQGLGIWPGSGLTCFDLVQWVALERPGVSAPSRTVLVVHVAENRANASIAVAGQTDGGATVVLVFAREGMSWVEGMVAELYATRDIGEVRLAPGEARGLEGDLTRRGVEFKPLTQTDIAASCTAFQDAVSKSAKSAALGGEPAFVHTGQRELDTQIAKARTRRQGPAQTWDDETGSAVIAAAAAYHRWTLQEAPLPAIY